MKIDNVIKYTAYAVVCAAHIVLGCLLLPVPQKNCSVLWNADARHPYAPCIENGLMMPQGLQKMQQTMTATQKKTD